jgi:hypothetical protein
MTVVLSPGLPGSPLLPSAPGAPCGPAGPGTTTVVGAGAGAGAGAGTWTTVGLSQAESAMAAKTAEASIEYFMVIPLEVENRGQLNVLICDCSTVLSRHLIRVGAWPHQFSALAYTWRGISIVPAMAHWAVSNSYSLAYRAG